MNFISTFDELNKLYESTDEKSGDKAFKDPKVTKILARLKTIADKQGIKVGLDNMKGQTDLIRKNCSDAEVNLLKSAELADGTVVNLLDEALNEYYDEEAPLGRGELYPEARAKSWGDPIPKWLLDKYNGNETAARAAWNRARKETKEMNNWRNPWESVENKNNSESLDEYYDEEAPLGRYQRPSETVTWGDPVPKWFMDKYGYRDEQSARAAWNRSREESRKMNNWRNAWESLEEDGEIELIDDAAEIPTEEAEFDQVILECDKCGALSIVEKADMEVDEETDLVNVKDKCKACEEKVGYKIIGCVAPYITSDDEAEDTEVDVSDEAAGDMVEEETAESLPETD